jgi:hypothetical protein
MKLGASMKLFRTHMIWQTSFKTWQTVLKKWQRPRLFILESLFNPKNPSKIMTTTKRTSTRMLTVW